MEEDIKIVEDFIEGIKECGLSDCSCNKDLQIKSIENLIKGYKELEERNKELYETCCRYEDTLEHYEYKIFDELDDYIKLDEISKLDKIGIKGKKYISESLIKEKIEELVKEGDYKTEDNPKGRVHFQPEPCDYQIQVLQELLNTKM